MTTSLDLSKKLLEKGLILNAERWWVIYDTKWFIANKNDGITDTNNQVPALSAGELLAILPPSFLDESGNEGKLVYIYLQIDKHPDVNKGYRCKYYPKYNPEAQPFYNLDFMDVSLPEALGKMCLWLLDNGYYYNPKAKTIVIDRNFGI
jgi:hypothetical protein